MAINVEAEVNEAVEENAFLSHFHFSADIYRPVVQAKYNRNAVKGFTLLLKETDGVYQYQIAEQPFNKEGSFSRLIGRYLVYTKALEEGFIDVPNDVYADIESSEHQANAILRYVTSQFVAKYPVVKETPLLEDEVLLPGLPTPVKRESVNEAFVAMFEDLLLQVVGVESAKLNTTYDEETESTTIEIVVGEDLDEDEEFSWNSLEHKSITVRRNKDDEPNQYFARYYALYKLFTRITD